MPETLVSVIVPVYGVERFVERCAVSLFEQTLTDGLEIIFVDDASPDRSIAIIEETLSRYPNRKSTTTIIHHSINKGLPAARNTGLAHAHGRYIFHCDSDDYLQHDALEQQVDYALSHEADIVWCDWYLSFHANERHMTEPSADSPDGALQRMMCGAMKFNVWNKLALASLYHDHHIRFPEGHAMGEDMTMMLLFLHAKRVAHLPMALYHYVKTNDQAISRSHSANNLKDLDHNIQRVTDYVVKKRGNSFDAYLGMLRLHVKLPFLVSGRRDDFLRWHELYPEANRWAMANPYLPVYLKMLQWMAAKRQWWYVKLYHTIIHRLVYGIIYR